MDFCKWDPQVGDISTLANFPLIISHGEWSCLKTAAEELARETIELEYRLLDRPDLHRELGLPRQLRALFRNKDIIPTPTACRVMRFDFHPTVDGWRVSEVNSDVPGGFTEASTFTALIAEAVDGTTPTGDPQSAYVDRLANVAKDADDVMVLLAASGFLEDQQVIAGVAARLRIHGMRTVIGHPKDVEWIEGRAFIHCGSCKAPVAAIVRFYQGEWLAKLPPGIGWHNLFAGGRTPVANPGCAVLTESKRLPLVWDELGVACPAWKRFLPMSLDPWSVRWWNNDGWLLKAAFCNTGDAISAPDLFPKREWRRRCLDVLLHPDDWVAQKRFAPLAIETCLGPMIPCIGVYTIDGRACGTYGRLASTPIINYSAIDAAVLLEQDSRSIE